MLSFLKFSKGVSLGFYFLDATAQVTIRVELVVQTV